MFLSLYLSLSKEVSLKEFIREFCLLSSIICVFGTVAYGGFIGFVYSGDETISQHKVRTCDNVQYWKTYEKCRRGIVDDMYEFYSENRSKVKYHCELLAQETNCKEL